MIWVGGAGVKRPFERLCVQYRQKQNIYIDAPLLPQSTFTPRVQQCLSPRPNWDPPPPLPQASVFPSGTKGGKGRPVGEGGGVPIGRLEKLHQFGRLEKLHSILSTLCLLLLCSTQESRVPKLTDGRGLCCVSCLPCRWAGWRDGGTSGRPPPPPQPQRIHTRCRSTSHTMKFRRDL
jgi:hypothetical protein